MEKLNKITELRLEQGLTQQELAVKMGVAVATISHYECGKLKKMPQKRMIYKMAQIFGKEYEEIANIFIKD